MIDKNAKKWVWLQPGAFFASTSTHDFEPTWGQNRRPKIAFWTKSIGNLYDFWKTACVETERPRPRPPRGPKVTKWATLARKLKIKKPLKNKWNFDFSGFKRAMAQCDKIVGVATKSLKIHWFYSVFWYRCCKTASCRTCSYRSKIELPGADLL